MFFKIFKILIDFKPKIFIFKKDEKLKQEFLRIFDVIIKYLICLKIKRRYDKFIDFAKTYFFLYITYNYGFTNSKS